MSPIESEARTLRDKIYGTFIRDEVWEKIKGNWIADLTWLREQRPLRFEYPSTQIRALSA